MKYYFFTGAGLSKESGLNTFRDSNDGTWVHHDLNQVCNFLTYKNNLDAVFDFYTNRKKEILNAQPNEAHKIIAEIQKDLGIDRVAIYTQNIDDLLERAGCKNVIHLHGNIQEMKCYGCGHIWNIGLELYNEHRKCPRCSCVRAIKPNVVFFQEQAPEYAKLHILRKTVMADDAIIAIGTSFNVIGEEMIIPSRRVGSRQNIQINPELTDERYWGTSLKMTATEGLKHLKINGMFL
jgi:NAD-dependent deacetylase